MSVLDRGPGLPPGEEPRVFDKFYRAPGASTDRRVLGLGLAICRGLVELHGGTIVAFNRQGAGPASPSRCPPRRRHAGEGRRGCLTNRRRRTRRWCCSSTTSRRSASSSASPSRPTATARPRRRPRGCLSHAATDRPDLILLDLGLPDGDGIDVVRQIREWGTMPILILSARGQQGARARRRRRRLTDQAVRRRRAARPRSRRAATRGRSSVTVGCCPSRRRSDRRLVEATRDLAGKPVKLTPNEYRLLTVLARNAGLVLTHQQLLREVWGPGSRTETHYLRVYVNQLRQKLTSEASHEFIETVPGVGYRLVAI